MHTFTGKWITDGEFAQLPPRNVFFRQLSRVELPCEEHRDRHILFRKTFALSGRPEDAKVYLSADDYYKLYINGRFVGQGPAPSYHFRYNYNVIDAAPFLTEGENVIAVHTLYQGLVNRVWQSGDQRHGLILDLVADGETVVSSDGTFRTKPHSAYREIGVAGYKTQFLEEYDSNAPEVGFEKPEFDDADWERARLAEFADYTLKPQESKALVFEDVAPEVAERNGNRLFLDFGSNYVGYLRVTAVGKRGGVVTIRCGQELNDDGSVRWQLRANCAYEETWILTDGESVLDQYDYKSFRYAELLLPDGCEVKDVCLRARHYPFELKARLNFDDARLAKIWELCVHTQKYGVQEVIQDCMEREKGFYVGDGCYTALTNLILTRDDSMARKLIDDAFSADCITDGLVTCLDCSFMQEIAEYPMMLVYLVWWHYRLTGDRDFLAANYPKAVRVLESYRRDYEKDGLLQNLDKWCVVEWPKKFQDNYGVDVKEGKVCEEPHVSINAYYLEAIRTANRIAAEVGLAPYRDEAPLVSAFLRAFYDPERRLFRDGTRTEHASLIGNVTAFGLGLCPDSRCEDTITRMIETRKLSSVSLFGAFLALMGYARIGRREKIPELMCDEGAWLRMLSEGATTTFEGWGRDTKWNTSLFHLTLSYGAVFLSDIDPENLFA